MRIWSGVDATPIPSESIPWSGNQQSLCIYFTSLVGWPAGRLVQRPMRPTRLFVPLMFGCRLTAIWGNMLSSNCSLLDPGPPRWTACRLNEVCDFWVREPLAVLVWRSSRLASPSTPCTPTAWTGFPLEPAVSVRGCELEKLALRRYVVAEAGALARTPLVPSRKTSWSELATEFFRWVRSLCCTSAKTPRPPCGGMRLLTTS